MEKRRKKEIVLIGLGTAAAGILGYFGWQYWRGRKERFQEEADTVSIPEPPQKSAFVPSSPQRNDEFPLKKGSKGARVKALQETLIAKYGKSILPKYGADGDFGSEMVVALKKLSLPESIDETTFNVLTKGNTIDPKEVAKKLFDAAIKKNLQQVLFTLRGMKTTQEYSSVSEAFQLYRIGGVRKTLVNGLLDSFPNEQDKQKIRLEFSRMGLKYDGNKWSLSGLEGSTIITREATVVWKNPRVGIKVPSNMVLGTEITERDGYTVFENNGQQFLVQTKTVRYL
jgi:hypothetical protein